MCRIKGSLTVTRRVHESLEIYLYLVRAETTKAQSPSALRVPKRTVQVLTTSMPTDQSRQAQSLKFLDLYPIFKTFSG